MFSPDVRFEGFTSSDWTRVLSLFQPRRAAGERDPERPRGGVVAIHEGGKLQKLLHTAVGRLRLEDVQKDFPMPASELARRHHASWAAIVERGALERVMERFAARARRRDDLSAQLLMVAELAQEEMIAGHAELWPHRLRGVPIPSAGIVRGTIDSVCPPGKTLLVGLFEGGELWTSIALRRVAAGFDLVLGPDEIRRDMGLLAGDWRRDYRHLARAVEDRASPLALGCFAEASTIRALEVDPTPGAWAKAAAVRDLILSPVPAALAIPLGIDAGRAALSALRMVAERLDPIGVVRPSIDRLKQLTDRDVERVLGFHPLELLRKMLSRER